MPPKSVTFFFAKILFVKGAGTPPTDKIRKVVFKHLPKDGNELSGMADMLSFHPAHGQLPQTPSLAPTALIPFCSFASDLTVTGKNIPGFNFPVCNSFKPVILDGNLCHQFDKSLIPVDIKSGKENGLMFMVDLNSERSLDIVEEDSSAYSFDTLRLGKENGGSGTRTLAKVHISTLAPFYGEGPGDYAISSVKKMTGTENFIAMPDSEKQCQIEDFVECKNRNFFTQGKILCGNCIPWILQRVHGEIEVRG